jgi:hypothetical protein
METPEFPGDQNLAELSAARVWRPRPLHFKSSVGDFVWPLEKKTLEKQMVYIIPYDPILSQIIPYYPILSHIILYYPILSHIIPYIVWPLFSATLPSLLTASLAGCVAAVLRHQKFQATGGNGCILPHPKWDKSLFYQHEYMSYIYVYIVIYCISSTERHNIWHGVYQIWVDTLYISWGDDITPLVFVVATTILECVNWGAANAGATSAKLFQERKGYISTVTFQASKVSKRDTGYTIYRYTF